MKKNVGNIDKGMRLIIAAALFPLLLLLKGPAKWIGLVSMPLVGTVLTGKCGVYTALGISTCKVED